MLGLVNHLRSATSLYLYLQAPVGVGYALRVAEARMSFRVIAMPEKESTPWRKRRSLQ